MKKQQGIIGPTELIDLPEAAIFNVPAKVDSGAYSSAIWASQIKQTNDELSFVLFDKQSPFYTGKVLKTTQFSSAQIRNSFGHVEERYKVPLMLRINGRTVRATVTLANRSANRFPILLGRRTVKGKFLIDLSRTPVRPQTDDILILMAKVTPKARAFFAGIEQQSLGQRRCTVASYDDLFFSLTGRANHVLLMPDGKDIAEFKFVYFKGWNKHQAIAAAAATHLKAQQVSFFDPAILRHPATSKLQQYVALRAKKVSVPVNMYMHNAQLVNSLPRLTKELSLPFVLKDIEGNNGKNNYLIHDEAEFTAVCNEAIANSVELIAQKFIPNDGDFRLLVMGNEVEVIFQRVAKGNTHLNNTSTGGEARLTGKSSLPAVIRKRAITLAQDLGWGIAGVDMIKDKTSGKWYCLEVNDAPQLVSGAFVQEKQAAFERLITNAVK